MANVLIVDDERGLRVTMREFALREGHEVHVAQDVSEALCILEEESIDVLISDQILPKESGMTLLMQVRKRWPRIQVVIVTGEPHVESAIEAVRAGAFDYLAKPVDIDQLMSIVQNAARRKQLFDEEDREEARNNRKREALEELVQERTQALDESEKRYKRLTENLQDMIWHMDGQGNGIYVNPAVERLLGYTEKEILAMGMEEYLTPPSYAHVMRRLAEARDDPPGKRHYQVEIQYIRKDGSLMDAEVYVTANRDALGNILTLDGITRDVSERRRMAEAAKIRDAALESSMTGLAIADLDGRLTYVNRAFCRMLGHDRAEELLGRYAGSLWEEKGLGRQIDKALKEQGSWLGELTALGKDGRKVEWLLSSQMIRDERGVPLHLMASAMDITEKQQMEREKRKLEEKLQQAVKMEAIGRLAEGMAQDFQDLLARISSRVSLAMGNVGRSDPLYEVWRDVDQTTRKAKELVRQWMSIGSRREFDMKSMDLSKEIENTREELGRGLRKTDRLELKLSERSMPILGDAGQIRGVVLKLVDHLRQTLPEDGGRILLELSEITLDEAYARLHPQLAPGDYIQLSISDNGRGLTKEESDRLFEPFLNTGSGRESVGPGLSLAWGIVRQHKGAIDVYSEPGYGTAFKIHFPRHLTEEAAERSDAPIRLRYGTETILYVEDELLVRDLTLAVFRRLGYNVVLAKGGREALRLYESKSSQIDLLFSDIFLPDINGIEIAEKIRTDHPAVKVLLTSGYSREAIQDRGILERNAPFIEKPYSTQGLAEALRSVLDG